MRGLAVEHHIRPGRIRRHLIGPPVLECPPLSLPLHQGVGASDASVGESVGEIGTTEPQTGQVHWLKFEWLSHHVWPKTAKATAIVRPHCPHGTHRCTRLASKEGTRLAFEVDESSIGVGVEREGKIRTRPTG